MPSEPAPPTVAQIVQRAVETCDPDGLDEGASQLLARFEDRDEPITSLADIETEVLDAKAEIDPHDEDPPLMMASAVAVYLAHRRDHIDAGRTDLLRLAARAEYDGSPPTQVADWLTGEGVRI